MGVYFVLAIYSDPDPCNLASYESNGEYVIDPIRLTSWLL